MNNLVYLIIRWDKHTISMTAVELTRNLFHIFQSPGPLVLTYIKPVTDEIKQDKTEKKEAQDGKATPQSTGS